MNTSCPKGFLVLLASVLPLAAQENTKTETGWTGVLDEKEFAALHELKKGKAPKLHGKDLTVGRAKAYLSLPKGTEPQGAVLVIHEWWGLNDNIKHWADRLAADGHAALAIDLYGGVVATTREDAAAAMRAVDPEQATKTLQAALAFLKKDKRVAAKKTACMGWCFGGGWSLKLAMAAPDLDAAVIYYGRLVTDPARLAPIGAPILGVFGNQDRGIPPAAVDRFEKAMKAAKKSVRVLRYDANHAFANPSSARYASKPAAAAWKEVRRFLDTRLAHEDRFGSFRAGKKVQFLLPRGWEKLELRPMRVANFFVGDDVQCYVTVLGGNGGGVAANVNRWRTQMGKDALSDAEIAVLPSLQILGGTAPMLIVDDGAKEKRMVVTMRTIGGSTIFVKMLGPKKIVEKQQAAFERFCTSFLQGR